MEKQSTSSGCQLLNFANITKHFRNTVYRSNNRIAHLQVRKVTPPPQSEVQTKILTYSERALFAPPKNPTCHPASPSKREISTKK